MHFQGEILKLARINKKAAAIIAAIVVAGSCTSAAVFQIHRNNSQDNLDSSAVQTEKKQCTPEDMASYIQDSNSLIAEDTQKQIQLYNANWKNAYNQVVAIAITTEDPSESLAKGLRTQMDLADRDSIILIKPDGIGVLDIGSESPLCNSKIATDMKTSSDDIQSIILSKFAEINEYLSIYVNPVNSEGRKSFAEWEETGAQIFENYQNTVSAFNLLAADVSDYNQENYPGATVWQASNGGITTFCISGSRDDAESFWLFYYDKLINGAADGKFTQKYVPSDLDQPRSVYGYMAEPDDSDSTADPIIYYRADLIGDVCVTASATDESQVDTITQFFNTIGVPQNENVVY